MDELLELRERLWREQEIRQEIERQVERTLKLAEAELLLMKIRKLQPQQMLPEYRITAGNIYVD